MHYGIYIGGGEVIHYNNRNGAELSGKDNDVIQTSLEEFLKGDKLYVVKEKRNSKYTAFPPGEVVKRAKSALGKHKGKYNLFIHNCEHFAYWCKYGVSESGQIQNLMEAVKIILAGMILA